MRSWECFSFLATSRQYQPREQFETSTNALGANTVYTPTENSTALPDHTKRDRVHAKLDNHIKWNVYHCSGILLLIVSCIHYLGQTNTTACTIEDLLNESHWGDTTSWMNIYICHISPYWPERVMTTLWCNGDHNLLIIQIPRTHDTDN